MRLLGPDSIKFLNGLITSKLQPNFVKKNLTTLSTNEREKDKQLALLDFTKNNWGIYKECNYMEDHISRFGTYTGFLNMKGKLLTDSIIYPFPFVVSNVEDKKFPEYLIEFDTHLIDRMERTFKNHKLLSKVKFKHIENSELRTWDTCITMPEEFQLLENLLNPMQKMKDGEQALHFAKFFASLFFQGNEDKLKAVYFDTRLIGDMYEGKMEPMFRVVTDNSVDNINDIFNCTAFDGNSFEKGTTTTNEIQQKRFKLGLFDGNSEYIPETLLALEANFDYFEDTVNSDKGCYVGQELTARTFATGVLKKRCVGISIDEPSKLQGWDRSKYLNIISKLEVQVQNQDALTVPNPFGSSSKPVKKRTRPAGQLINYNGNVGIAVVRKEYIYHALKHNHDIDAYIELPNKETVSCSIKLEWLDRFREEPEEEQEEDAE
ncbi:unnamed protein product [Kluyveromyces dobzhanskii CBS 2104]|uniref:WGS project CCBQ000000000 data, contig 00102 n=1 Tax=Kluyveromyces dobzhanskii CBS 2104 TaxID=1427455 RepID=A0A0A8L6B0_9SACH|nr:unnamed protein product [Kluyveromyces dobzhanskii CBS 2104]